MNAPSRATLGGARVLVVGDVMLDRYWFGDVDRISPEAPVPVVRIRNTEERLGGAANVARNITAVGGAAGLLAAVGDDEAGRAIVAMLAASDIESYVHTESAVTTTVKLRLIGRSQQMLRADFERAPQEEVLLKHLDTFASALPPYQLVVLSDYGKGGLAHITQLIELARTAGKRVLVDPKGDSYASYRGATMLTPNRAELREVVGRWKDEADLEVRAQKLRRDLGLQALLLTRSEEGMTLFTDDGAWSVPAQAREVFDVSGAGDTVIAVLATMLASGAPMRDAVAAANRAGGIAVSKFGATTVSYDELFGADQ
ncbi:MAG: D-glycero-beta-D-manno-heptose-7-phosphate kinase [Burkholderiaceae bacterium]